MDFVSTRNQDNKASFSQAITNCLCSDGGLYIPSTNEDLRPWVYYLKNTTSFSSIAGSLTSALLKEEFSPIISEAIATNAFLFAPDFTQLDDNLYKLSLFTGPTGSHKDFGVSYLVNCLEYTLLLQDKKAVVFAISDGEIGSSLAHAMRNKKQLKALVLYSKGSMRGFEESDCLWNGGNIYPVEVDASLSECSNLARQLFSREDLVNQYNLTLANTVNIGRLLPQTFFYLYAFSQLRGKVFGDIFYAVAPGNYGNLVAGLYGWKFSLPVNAFITECTNELKVDGAGKAQLEADDKPLEKRAGVDPGSPSNLERLEEVFQTQPMMLRGLIFPQQVSEADRVSACKELFKKYAIFANGETAGSYAAAKKYTGDFADKDSTVVLVSRDHPALMGENLGSLTGKFYGRDWIGRICGEAPEVPDYLARLLKPIEPEKKISCTLEEVVKILEEISSL